MLLVMILFIILPLNGRAQQSASKMLSLSDFIQLAHEKSLAVLRAQNTYLTTYWQYRNYRAKYLPSLELGTNPATYNRSVDVIYSVIDSVNIITERQTFNTDVNLRLNQNILKTGGVLFFDTELSRTETILPEQGKQYASTPVRIGLNQPLFAYNQFKWEKKIEPLRLEVAKKSYLRDREEVTIRATELFFDLLIAERNLAQAKINTANADTLYRMGEKRFQIAGIEKTDLYTLKLDLLNRQTMETVAENDRMRAETNLFSMVGLPLDQTVILQTPDEPPVSSIDEQTALAKAKENSPFFPNLHLRRMEVESEVDRLKRESFSANLDTSFGLNDAESSLDESYRNLNQQQRFSISLRVPIIDWGQRKGRYKLSERRLENVDAELAQNKTETELNITMAVREFNLQKRLLENAKISEMIAIENYDMAKKRFLLGRGDVNTLANHLTRQDNTVINYLRVLRRYWSLYNSLRRDTLYDFKRQIPLSTDFETLHDF